MEHSLRKKDDKRKLKRAEIKERKEKEKQQKKEELKKLQELKRKEIEEKIQQLKEITGNTEIGFNVRTLCIKILLSDTVIFYRMKMLKVILIRKPTIDVCKLYLTMNFTRARKKNRSRDLQILTKN